MTTALIYHKKIERGPPYYRKQTRTHNLFFIFLCFNRNCNTSPLRRQHASISQPSPPRVISCESQVTIDLQRDKSSANKLIKSKHVWEEEEEEEEGVWMCFWAFHHPPLGNEESDECVCECVVCLYGSSLDGAACSSAAAATSFIIIIILIIKGRDSWQIQNLRGRGTSKLEGRWDERSVVLGGWMIIVVLFCFCLYAAERPFNL